MYTRLAQLAVFLSYYTCRPPILLLPGCYSGQQIQETLSKFSLGQEQKDNVVNSWCTHVHTHSESKLAHVHTVNQSLHIHTHTLGCSCYAYVLYVLHCIILVSTMMLVTLQLWLTYYGRVILVAQYFRGLSIPYIQTDEFCTMMLMASFRGWINFQSWDKRMTVNW